MRRYNHVDPSRLITGAKVRRGAALPLWRRDPSGQLRRGEAMKDKPHDDSCFRSRHLTTLASRDLADFFRGSALRWRGPMSPLEEYELGTECGLQIIEADDYGHLPTIDELRRLIDWHTAEETTSEDRPGFAVYVRCPSNLFLDVAGGTLVYVRQIQGRWTVVEDPRRGTARHGGLLPSERPAVLRMTDKERKAVACEWLATLIEEHADTKATLATTATPGEMTDTAFEAAQAKLSSPGTPWKVGWEEFKRKKGRDYCDLQAFIKGFQRWYRDKYGVEYTHKNSNIKIVQPNKRRTKWTSDNLCDRA